MKKVGKPVPFQTSSNAYFFALADGFCKALIRYPGSHFPVGRCMPDQFSESLWNYKYYAPHTSLYVHLLHSSTAVYR